MTRREWIIYETDGGAVSRLAGELNISELLAVMLLSRGVTSGKDAQAFLYAGVNELSDPAALHGASEAVDILLGARKEGAKVLVYGDYDVDGITGAVTAHSILRQCGLDLELPFAPHRVDQGYGLNPEIIREAARRDVKIVMTVDCGITDLEAVVLARSLGMKVIVTDHHKPGKKLPDADVIVDPLLGCDAEAMKSLAGVGVAFNVMRLLAVRSGMDAADVLKYLDLVCLGTVADSVPLTGDNRIIVRHGLQRLRTGGRIGLRALCDVIGIDREDMTSERIAFSLGPRLNAPGRIGSPDMSMRLLLSEDGDEAWEIAKAVDGLNTERRDIEELLLARARRYLEEKGRSRSKVILVAGRGWHRGVLGIVASRLAEEYGKPSVVISVDDKDVGYGSVRSVGDIDILEAMQSASKHLSRWGGHAMAAGLEVSAENIEKFYRTLNTHMISCDHEIPAVRRLKIDAVLQPDQIDNRVLDDIRAMEPYGSAVPTPLFIARSVSPVAVTVVGRRKPAHLKMQFAGAGGAKIEAICFGRGEDVSLFKESSAYDIVYAVEENIWQGRRSLQMRIVDYDVSGNVGIGA